MIITGHQEFVNATQDMNNATKKTLLPILEKLSKECGGSKSDDKPKKVVRDKSPQPAMPQLKEEFKQPGGSFAKAAKEKEAAQKRPATAAPGKLDKIVKEEMPDEEEGPRVAPLRGAAARSKRQEADLRNKWPLEETSGDHIDRLKKYCMDAFGRELHDLMWAKSGDF